MHDLLLLLAVFSAALLGSLLLTPPARELAKRLGMVDRPDARRIHLAPIARGGGMAVFVAFHLALLLANVLRPGGHAFGRLGPSWHVFFLVASSVLLVVGLLDDAFGMRPFLKLAGQVVVAAMLYASGARVGGILWFDPPESVDFILTLFWFVGAINAFNLIDGMDGLASGLALISSLGLAACLFSRNLVGETLPLMALAGAALGFLRYNFHPASVFLGDCGSMFLGLVLAAIPLYTGAKAEFLASLGVPLLAMGVPIFDTLLAVWRRSVRAALPSITADAGQRVRVMQADKEHLHHRLLAAGMNQRRAALALYGINGLLVAVGVLGLLFRVYSTGIFLLGFILAVFIVVRHLSRVELWDTGRALLSSTRSPLSLRLVVPLYIAFDVLTMSAVWMFSRKLTFLPLTRSVLLRLAPPVLLPVFVALVLSGAYRRVWSRARVRDYALLMVATSLACVVGYAFSILIGVREPGSLRQIVVFAAFVQLPLIAVRIGRELLAETLAAIERMRLLDKPDTQRVLVYGGGERFRLFVREGRTHIGRAQRVIVGILDDDINLRGRMVDGYPVLGQLADLVRLVTEHHIDGVIITATVTERRREELVLAARVAGVRLAEWQYAEQELVSSPESVAAYDAAAHTTQA